jgi:hypothetical protein
LRSTGAKGYSEPIPTNKPVVVVRICNSSYAEGVDRRMIVQGQPWAKTETIRKITKSKIGLGHDSSGEHLPSLSSFAEWEQ